MQPTVQFIDDDQRILDSLRRSLMSNNIGWNMVFDSDPVSASEWAMENDPEVIVCDMRMPGMDGISLLKKLRRGGVRSRAIVLTGYDDMDVAQAAVNDCEVFRFYTKPCALDTLIGSIEDGIKADARTGAPDLVRLSSENEIFDILAGGLILLDSTASIIYTNTQANRILGEAGGLQRDSKGKLQLRFRGKLLDMPRLLDRARAESRVNGVAVDPGDADFPLSLLIQHLTNADQFACFISDPRTVSTPSAEAIARVLNISPSEAGLVYQLARGASVAEAAKLCNLSVQSARTYLKRVFQKTRVRRQPELVRLVYSLFNNQIDES